jgi:hypothetical protein
LLFTNATCTATRWQLCVKKLNPDVESGTPAMISALGAKPLGEVDMHRLEMARDLIVGAVDPANASMVNGRAAHSGLTH